MARAGGTTKISPYKDALYSSACLGIALDLPSKYIQDRALAEFGETLNPVTISNLRRPEWRQKNAQKWDKLIKEIERDFITRVGDRKFLFPIFRFFYYKEWGELCAIKDSFEPGKGYHGAAVQYFNLCEKAIEHVPGHKLLAEACLSETVQEIQEVQGNASQAAQVDVETIVIRMTSRRTIGADDMKVLMAKKVEKE